MTLLRYMSRMTQYVFFMCFLFYGNSALKAGDSLTITKEFNLITSANASGYLKPLFTSVSESFNSNTFTVARFARQWRLGLDISVCGMFIPSSQLTFDAELPSDYGSTGVTQTSELRGNTETRNGKGTVSQPTIYGGISNPTFSASQTSVLPSDPPKQPATVTFLEGNNTSFMSGVPALQINAGFPTRTQLRLRFIPVPVDGKSMSYFGMMVSQQFNHLVGLFTDDSLIGIALNAGFHSLSRSQGISVSSFAVGVHGSKTWQSGLSLYGGLQYEDMSGTINFVREKNATSISKSPFEEIRKQADLNLKVETFTNFRLGAGVSYKTGIIELHADAALASQPVLAFGMTFWFMNLNVTKPNGEIDDSYDFNKDKQGVQK
ncbi:MAG: hypothetical protein JST20_09830 [Bacteroidetes bacterium]|nr:hypothetical protein [Bacteroidota bacterium]